MDRAAWDERLLHFVMVRKVKPSTRELYSLRLGIFLKWCSDVNVSPENATPASIAAYVDYLQAIPHKASTVEGELQVLRLFYKWLVSEGICTSNPAEVVEGERVEPLSRDTLSAAQLSQVWSNAKSDRQRVIIALLSICGLKSNELVNAEIGHIGVVEGRNVLRIPTRQRQFESRFVVLPDEVFAVIARYVGDRTNGPLVLRRDGTAMDRRALYGAVASIGAAAKLPFRVTPITLSFTLRALAIEHGFSYVSVIRTVAEVDARRLAKWVAKAPISIGGHASYRMARLILGSGNDTEDHFMHAEVLLTETESHPAAALSYVGAALERHLRELADAKHLAVRRPEPTLASYSSVLRTAKAITASDVQQIAQIQTWRNHAAHGWFERVGTSEAEEALRQARDLVRQYPLPPAS
ncbi:tyrosine-type recombinase/integrase [Marisediminicola senii]|uniref:tyrosine-type recombinase/integrase n=1 Tax=Marisediminicola senii TaxID=2711233 RepID=UPI0013EBB8E2|nr:phage integrase N-terminal SAM-like domain-containing protein [Marisediminicola senii]